MMAVDGRELIWFRRVCRFIAVFPLVLGGTIAFTGTAGFGVLFGVDAPDVSPTFESGVRFLATAFLGMGLVLLWATQDVAARNGAMKIFFATMILGASARLIAIGVHGAPNLMSLVLIGIELTGAPMWLWLSRILRS